MSSTEELEMLPQLMASLKVATESKSSEVVSLLDSVLRELKRIVDDAVMVAVAKKLIQNGLLVQLKRLLSSSSELTVAKAAETVAEVAKLESVRGVCAESELVTSLIHILGHKNGEAVQQACRALGNICYENDCGRNHMLDAGGFQRLTRLMETSERSDGEAGTQLRTVTSGLLLNLVNGYEPAQKKFLDATVLDILCTYLEKDCSEDDTCSNILLIFSCLADREHGRQKLIDRDISKVMVHVMANTQSVEVVEFCLDLFTNLAENDQVKGQLARAGFCEMLIDLFRKHQPPADDDESRGVMKVACDLIVLILTGDESMNILYGGGEGKLFVETVAWLQSNDEDLQIAAALAMGNFARNDEHCKQMVEKGVCSKLLHLVRKNSTADGDIRLQHACLSALRNLAIPQVNKPLMLEQGAMAAVIPMIAIETFPVVFKLLGTLRMLIDGQESSACTLGQNKDFVHRLVEWCQTEDHPGVQGEATRLLAWLIKHSRNTNVMKLIKGEGGFQHLVTMVTSEHEVMKNEALVALNLVGACVLTDATDVLISAGLGLSLRKVFSTDGVSPEIRSNAVTLVESLVISDQMKVHLRDSGLAGVLKSEKEAVLLEQCQKLAKTLGLG